MKRIFAFLLLLFPFVSFANDIANMSTNDTIAIFDETLPFIEERMKEINPDLVAKMANAENMDKIYEYQNFMARHIFDIKTKHYIEKLYNQAESMGYSVTNKSFPDGTQIYSVDQDPSMKTPECYKDGTMASDRICPYPMNYNFSHIQIRNNYFFQCLLDDMNTINYYKVVIQQREGFVYLNIDNTETSHAEQINYLNRRIYCSSEERPYVLAYKECIAKNPEQGECQDDGLDKLFTMEFEKCLGKYKYLPEMKISSGAFREFKTW